MPSYTAVASAFVALLRATVGQMLPRSALAWLALAFLALGPFAAQAQQDTFSLGLRLTQSVTDVSNPASSTTASIVNMVYGDAAQSSADQVLTTLTGGADPRVMAQIQSFGNGTQSIAQIEASAKALLQPQQTTLLSQMRLAATANRVAGVVWILSQVVRPIGSARNMKLSWYLMIAPGGRVITSDPKVTEEDPTVVYMVYYSKAVGRSLPASYAWADAGLVKWQLRRYNGTPVSGWTTVDVGGSYDAPESDSEMGPYCAATAETLGSCVQGQITARSLMAANASRKSVIDYVRAVDVSYNPATNGESTPDVKISFDTRVYTRTTCTVGTYRCAGSIGYTVVETLDRYTMTDTDSLPMKVNSLTGLNSSRPARTFDVTVSVSDKPAVVDPYVIDPFDTPLALVSTTMMPGIVNLAAMSVVIPPTNGDYICPAGTSQQGTQCVSTSVTPATVNYSCSSGTLSGSQCVSSSSSPATATTNYSCSSGTLVGASCIITSSTPATPSTSYSCSSGTLSGSSCITTSSTPATASSGYSCSSGTLSGSSCITTTTAPATATTSYSCPSGGTANGSTCTTTSTSSYAGTPTTSYSCSSGTVNGSTCTTTTTTTSAVTVNRVCTTGYNLSGDVCTKSQFKTFFNDGTGCPNGGEMLAANYKTITCVVDVSVASTTTYSCPDGFISNGLTCERTITTTAPATATTSYSCPSGGSLNGSTCTTSSTSSYAATATTSYSCSSGTLIGSTCYSSSSSPASYSTSYSCSSGTLSGSSCVSTSSSAASGTTTYSCSSGTLSGTSCIQSSSTPATSTINYTCSSGTLSGTSCITTSSSPATVGYSCTSGSLSGSNCVITNTTPATWVPMTCPD
jgi:hypothetical protein